MTIIYNRYIPQNDGTYRRTLVPEKLRNSGQPASKSMDFPVPEKQEEAAAESLQPKLAHKSASKELHRQSKPNFHKAPPTKPAKDFFRTLLPKDLETGDLLIIALLLLMSGDNSEDHNSALLTLALYLFM